jgi:hypothetical protein
MIVTRDDGNEPVIMRDGVNAQCQVGEDYAQVNTADQSAIEMVSQNPHAINAGDSMPGPTQTNNTTLRPRMASNQSLCLSGSQLLACLGRIATEKRRTVRGTCCEFTSHLIIMSILVFGFLLSKVENFQAKSYSSIDIKIPPASVASLTATDDSVTSTINPFQEISAFALQTYTNIMSGPLVVPDFDQYIRIGNFLSNYQSVVYGSLITQTGYGRSFTNLLFRGDLHFAPTSPATYDLINHLNSSYVEFSSLNIYVHDTEDEGVDFILNNLDSPALAFIVLREISTSKVNYVIRQNYTTLPNTNSIVESATIGLDTQYQQYFLSGFLSIERAIDQWVFEYTGATSNTEFEECAAGAPAPVMVPFPTFAYEQNPYYTSVGFLLGLAMIMSTMYPMSKLTKSIVEEKETKMRELMKIMGLKDWIHRFTWFITAFVLFFWIAVTSTLITSGSFLIKSDSFLLFLYFFLFTLSEITFAFLLSVFFSNSKLAAIVAPVLLFATILPRYSFYTTNNEEAVVNKVLACLLSPTAFAFGADIISDYEYGGLGVQYDNITTGKFNFFIVLFMLWIDFYIYAFLAWYFDQVIPHENGTAKHPLFIFSWRYWTSSCCCCCCYACCFPGQGSFDESHNFEDMPEFYDESTGRTGSTVEMILPQMRYKACVRIKSLGKRYNDGKVAVRNLSLSMLEDQITCLLGHNGAGS